MRSEQSTNRTPRSRERMYNVYMQKARYVAALGIPLVALLSFTLVAAWTDPTEAPPNGNVAAPINVGSTAQVKNGGLGVNTLTVFGNSLFGGGAGSNAYMNFGEISGSGGYGIRDNDGTLEFKNDGGDWASLQTVIFNLAGAASWTVSGNDIYNTNSGAVRTSGEFVSGQHVSMGYMSTGGSASVCYQQGAYWGSALGLTSCASDARLKANIVPLPMHTLDKIMNVNPVTFTWKKDASSAKHAGFIAQDTLLYVPEAVGVNPEDGYYTWDSNAMLSYTVKALQESIPKWMKMRPVPGRKSAWIHPMGRLYA